MEQHTRRPITIRVECHAGPRGEESPRRFYLGANEIAIVDIVDRWLGPNLRYFKVRAAERDVYILRHDNQTQQWEITLFSREDYLNGTETNASHAAGAATLGH